MKIFRFEVDETYAKKNNELLRDSSRLRNSGLIMGLLLIVGAVAVYLGVAALGGMPAHRDIGAGCPAHGRHQDSSRRRLWSAHQQRQGPLAADQPNAYCVGYS